MTSNNNPSKRLFIGSLPYQFTEGELLSLFVKFGKIVSLRIVKNRWGKSRGIGYVEYETIEEAQAAKLKMDKYYISERTIIVDFAQPDPFTTDEGRQRHYDSQDKRPLAKRKYLDEFGNRKFAVPRPTQAPVERTSIHNSRFEPKTFRDRDKRYNDDRPSASYDSRPTRSFGYNNAQQDQDSRTSSYSNDSRSSRSNDYKSATNDSRPTRSFSYNNAPRPDQGSRENNYAPDNQPRRNFTYNTTKFSKPPKVSFENSASLIEYGKKPKRNLSKGGKPVFNSLGKSLNKDRSGEYVPKFIAEAPAKPLRKFKPKFGQKPEYKSSDPFHVRGSIFKQRKFGSKVGAKFAHKTKVKQK